MMEDKDWKVITLFEHHMKGTYQEFDDEGNTIVNDIKLDILTKMLKDSLVLNDLRARFKKVYNNDG